MDPTTPNAAAKTQQQYGYKGNYGLELIMDLKECEIDNLTCERLTTFFIDLCARIDMTRHGDPMFWEDWSETPHLHGVSAVQFVETSNIVCHALPLLKAVYLNVFSCKEFDPENVMAFCKEYWGASSGHHTVVVRV